MNITKPDGNMKADLLPPLPLQSIEAINEFETSLLDKRCEDQLVCFLTIFFYDLLGYFITCNCQVTVKNYDLLMLFVGFCMMY